MSLKYEQYNSLKMTRDFLRLVMQSKKPKSIMEWNEFKVTAAGCLRHYPFLKEDGEPMFSKDNFTKD
jgi:hypothetical protein